MEGLLQDVFRRGRESTRHSCSSDRERDSLCYWGGRREKG
jgi:hypothetical protein